MADNENDDDLVDYDEEEVRPEITIITTTTIGVESSLLSQSAAVLTSARAMPDA